MPWDACLLEYQLLFLQGCNRLSLQPQTGCVLGCCQGQLVQLLCMMHSVSCDVLSSQMLCVCCALTYSSLTPPGLLPEPVVAGGSCAAGNALAAGCVHHVGCCCLVPCRLPVSERKAGSSSQRCMSGGSATTSTTPCCSSAPAVCPAAVPAPGERAGQLLLLPPRKPLPGQSSSKPC